MIKIINKSDICNIWNFDAFRDYNDSTSSILRPKSLFIHLSYIWHFDSLNCKR